jgi:hypothetical protein
VRFTAGVVERTVFCNDEGSSTSSEYQCGCGAGRRDPLKVSWSGSGQLARFVYRQPVAIGDLQNHGHLVIGVQLHDCVARIDEVYVPASIGNDSGRWMGGNMPAGQAELNNQRRYD